MEFVAAASSGDAPVRDGGSGYEKFVAAWVVVWAVAHFVLWSAWHPKRFFVLACSSNPLDRYRRRLFRSQVYCLGAFIGGSHLLYTRCDWTPHDLLYGFSVEHQMLFAMAAGHWIVAFWEDASNPRFLTAGLTAKDLSPQMTSLDGFREFVVRAQLLHHVVAACAYIAVLQLRACVAVCTFGLIFELPVIFMNIREFTILADRPPAWYRSCANVVRFWALLQVAFIIGRCGPSAVYAYSMIYWWEDVGALRPFEVVVYHGTAVFFGVLNFNLCWIFFPAWRHLDVSRAEGGTTVEAADGDDAFEVQDAQADQELIDETVNPVVSCTEEDLRANDGTGKNGAIWVKIEGIAYDVTTFLHEHPGGEAVLRKHAGKDASEGFSRVRHSVSAKILMQKYMIGPMDVVPGGYRIFEHPFAVRSTVMDYVTLAIPFVVLALALKNSALLDAVSGGPFDEATLAGIAASCVPGGVMGCLLGICTYGGKFLTGQHCVSWWKMDVNTLAICFVMFSVGFPLALLPLPSGAPPHCPTGLELATGLLFILEDLCELTGVDDSGRRWRGPWSGYSLLVLGALLSSWALRGASRMLEVAPRHVVGGSLLAFSVSSMLRTVRSWQNKDTAANAILDALVVSGPWSAAVVASILKLSHHAEQVCWVLLGSGWTSYAWAAFMTFTCALLVMQFFNSAYITSQAWTARSFAFTFTVALFCNGVTSWRWLYVVAAIGHFGCMSSRLHAQLEAKTSSEFAAEFVDLPHRVGTQGAWDQIRIFACMTTWRFICAFVVSITKFLLPEELTAYACSVPIFDLGDDVDLGIAAYFAPPRRRPPAPSATVAAPSPATTAEEGGPRHDDENERPNYFVCNLGHIDIQHAGGLNDLHRTMSTLRDVWHEFEGNGVKGLVASVVAVFPFVQDTLTAKEINLSAWSSAEDAHDWYVKSPGHRAVMKQHAGGQLRTFGNLMASLRPIDSVRFQDRCTRCRRLVEAARVGDPPPRRCGICGAKSFDYPLF